MSLINEALKKAQRQRHGDAAASQPDSGDRVAKRARPKSATSMLLIVAAGLVLVALSIVATTLWLTRPSTPAVAAAKPAAPATKSDDGKPPLVVVPPINAPAPATTPAPKSSVPAAATTATKPLPTPNSGDAAPAEATATTATLPPAATTVPSAPAKVSPAPVAASVQPERPATPPKPDERIHAFVEALRVTGIRSSGTESKVLMNDRVYRVNEIVDRALGLRLTKVAPDSLTFTDANGATYVKYF